MYCMARDLTNNKETMGKLHLIDLAGSERVGRSGVVGSAMTEGPSVILRTFAPERAPASCLAAQNINYSLSALGDVIAARGTVLLLLSRLLRCAYPSLVVHACAAAKQGHIPYRNSVLTYLLQDSLGLWRV